MRRDPGIDHAIFDDVIGCDRTTLGGGVDWPEGKLRAAHARSDTTA